MNKNNTRSARQADEVNDFHRAIYSHEKPVVLSREIRRVGVEMKYEREIKTVVEQSAFSDRGSFPAAVCTSADEAPNFFGS